MYSKSKNLLSYQKCKDCEFFQIIDVSTAEKQEILIQCRITGKQKHLQYCIKDG